WMRYDHTVPVSVPLLKRLLSNHKNNIFCRLIPDCFHSKVIWWKGYGAYIGSANLTERAWKTNIEAGVFLSESELQASNMLMDLELFFEGLSAVEESRPLTEEIIIEMEGFTTHRLQLEKLYEEDKHKRSIAQWSGPSHTSRKAKIDK